MYPHWKASFALLWTGQACSILTSAISQYALVWYLAGRSGSAATLSLATLFAMLPQGILTLFTGSVADRYDRRWIMALADGAIGLVSLGLAAAALGGELSTAAIFLALALRSVGAAFHSPCIQAVTPLIVPEAALTRCAGWSQGIQTISMLVSPALAAILYASFPLSAIIGLDTGGAALAVLFLVLARLPRLKVGGGEKPLHIFRDSLEGFRVLRSKDWLWQLSLLGALFSVVFMPVNALFPLMTMDYFGLNEGAAAFVETAFSIGMLLGSVILGIWGGTKDRIVTMNIACVGMGLCFFFSGLLPPSQFLLFTLLTFLTALCAPFYNSLFMALVQSKVEPEYLGRVLGISGAIMTLASPVGLMAPALLGDRFPLPFWFLTAGIGVVLCGILGVLLPAVRTCDRPPS